MGFRIIRLQCQKAEIKIKDLLDADERGKTGLNFD